MRRRMRFLRKARELAYRDLGGLVFDLHRFGRRNDALVLAKLETIGRIDTELRALEATLAERRPVTVLREAGVAACPRCAAIHGSDDRFCPNCGLAMDLRAERPMAGPQTAARPRRGRCPPPPAALPAPAMPPPTAVRTPAPAAPPPPPPPPGARGRQRRTCRTRVTRAGPTAPPAPATGRLRRPPTPAPRRPRPPLADGARARAPAGRAQVTVPPRQGRPGVDQPTEIVRPPAEDP